MRKLLLAGALALAVRAPAFSPPAWSQDQSVYEVNLETFSSQGTYSALESRLPELKALGVGILWLMPVTERGSLKAFGSPYCVRDYYGLHAPFGSAQDLKHLVAKAHSLGLHVIIDWVPNHSAWDNPLVKAHPEFYKHDAKGRIQQAFTWADVAQLDYAQKGLWTWMIAAMRHWILAYDIDGFRCDVAWNVPADFWVRARRELETVKPLFMLAESNEPRDQAAFDADYDWNLMNLSPQNPLTEIAAGRQPASVINAFVQQDLLRFKAPFTRLRYTSNHDEWKDQGTPDVRFHGGEKAFAVLTTCLPGRTLLYNGQEIGWRQQKGPIQWDLSPRAQDYTQFYRHLLSLRQEMPALRDGQYLKLDSNQEASLFAFVRQAGSQRHLVLLNLSPKSLTYTLKGKALQGLYVDDASGTKRVFTSTETFKAEPWGFQIWVDEKAAPLAEAVPLIRKSPEVESNCGDGGYTPVGHGAPATFRVQWDLERLRVDYRFNKFPVIQDSPLDQPWDDDSVELYLDMMHLKRWDYQPSDFQYIVGFGNPQLFESKGRTTKVQFSTLTGTPQSEAHLAIPWKTLGVTPQVGAIYGFDIGVNLDNDGGVRDQSFQWAGTDQNYRDASLFGDLKLAEPCPQAP